MLKLSFLPFEPQFKRPVVDGWMWAEGATPIWKFTSFLKANSRSSIEPIVCKSNWIIRNTRRTSSNYQTFYILRDANIKQK